VPARGLAAALDFAVGSHHRGAPVRPDREVERGGKPARRHKTGPGIVV